MIIVSIQVSALISPYILATPTFFRDKPQEHPQFLSQNEYFRRIIWSYQSKNSVGNRLKESIGQTNRVLINMTADYNPSELARRIKHYFEYNPNAKEVLIFKGKKQISVTVKSLEDRKFFQTFIRRYTK